MLKRAANNGAVFLLVIIVIGVACRNSSSSNSLQTLRLLEWREGIRKVIPADSTQLVKRLTFPSELGTASRGAFMKMPTRICLDQLGNSYILDSPSSCILKFNPKGDFVGQISRAGQGPGELSFPSLFLISGDSIIVDDVRNGRFQYLDLEGNFLRSHRTFEGYYSFATSKEGHLYVAPRRLPYKEGPLIKEISSDGYLISSFGTRPLAPKDSTSFDGVTIDVNTKGEVFVAFRLLALVRRYTAAGQLIREYRLNEGTMGLREKFNLELRDSRKPAKDKRYFVVIESLKATEDGFYVLANGSPCLEILRYDDLGNLKKSYFWDEDWTYYARDFAVWNAGEEELFYVVQISPDYCIDVFGQNTSARKEKE